MATHETWFVAADAELDSLFPGWVVAGKAEEPCVPLPIWTSKAPPMAPIRRPSLGSEPKVERRVPPGLRALPHWHSVDAPLELIEDLVACLDVPQEVPALRIGPADSSEDAAIVRGVPAHTLTKLAVLSDSEVEALCVDIENAYDAAALDQLDLLLALRDLAKCAVTRGSHLCLFVTL